MATVGQETGRAQKAVERVPRGLGSESHFGELLARCAGVQKRIKISLKFFCREPGQDADTEAKS